MPRGQKPLPAASLHVVLALLDGEMQGYTLMRRVAELSDGAVRMGAGTLYGTLNRLVADGLIEETTDRRHRDAEERRRYYQPTATGRAVAGAELDRLRALVHRVSRHLPGPAPAMTPERSVAVYRSLTRCYPRWFRSEYGDDLVLLFSDQLLDEASVRVWARALVDLIITIPARHLESAMPRPPASSITVMFTAVSIAELVVAAVSGTAVGPLIAGFSVAGLAALIAAISWRHSRMLTSPRSTHCWKFLGGGAASVAVLMAVTVYTGELSNRNWFLAIGVGLAAVGALVTGLVLAVAELERRRRHVG